MNGLEIFINFLLGVLSLVLIFNPFGDFKDFGAGIAVSVLIMTLVSLGSEKLLEE